MKYAMAQPKKLPISFCVLLVCCAVMHLYAQQFSQDFIAAVKKRKQKSIAAVHTKKRCNIYSIGSNIITATACVYAVYNVVMLYRATTQPSFMKSYILPSWMTGCKHLYSFAIGSIGIGIRTVCYKTIAQVLLVLTTGSFKEKRDYLFINKYEYD